MARAKSLVWRFLAPLEDIRRVEEAVSELLIGTRSAGDRMIDEFSRANLPVTILTTETTTYNKYDKTP